MRKRTTAAITTTTTTRTSTAATTITTMTKTATAAHHDHDHDEDGHCCHHDHDHDHEDGCCGHDHHHHPPPRPRRRRGVHQLGVETPKVFTEAAVRAALEALDSGSFGMILRAKGIVPAEDGTWLHFDFVPGEIDPAPRSRRTRDLVSGRAGRGPSLRRITPTGFAKTVPGCGRAMRAPTGCAFGGVYPTRRAVWADIQSAPTIRSGFPRRGGLYGRPEPSPDSCRGSMAAAHAARGALHA